MAKVARIANEIGDESKRALKQTWAFLRTFIKAGLDRDKGLLCPKMLLKILARNLRIENVALWLAERRPVEHL